MAMQQETWTDIEGTIHEVMPPGRINHHSSQRTILLRKYLMARSERSCQYCGIVEGTLMDDNKAQFRSITFAVYLEIDHIIPWRDGGSNHPDNLQMLCPKCNKQKMRFQRLWRTNDKYGTPNDYRDWVQRWVPQGYEDSTFVPDAWPEAGQGGVLNA